jgi:aminopeptidase-like protein
MGYSAPIDRIVSRAELLEMIHTLPEQPDWIPYVTSYYERRVGLCMSERQKTALTADSYHVVIDSDFTDGFLTYGEILLCGESEQEIFLSTYICHPSMANNELSGPCVATCLANWLSEAPRRYSYRIVFVPETIGAIAYLSKHLPEMRQKTVAGFNITCVGDEGAFSLIHSRYGNTLADKVAKNVLSFCCTKFKEYSFLKRGSDERQYCAPGVDLPVCGICRSKYGEYPEYHTSADNLDFISPEGLEGSFSVYRQCIEVLEANRRYVTKCICEPMLSKRGGYPTLSKKGSSGSARETVDFLAYADGTNDLVDISNLTGISAVRLIDIAAQLKEWDLIKEVQEEDA